MIVSGSANRMGRAAGGARMIGLDTRLAFALLCLTAISPLLIVGMPPLADMYGHYGRYVLQTDLHNRPELQQYYSYQWQLLGNLGADLLVHALYAVLGLETAIRVVVIATQAIAAAAILLLSKELHGRVTPFAVAALPLIYGMPFNYGFLNFSLSMALGLLAFVMWLRLQRSGNTIASQMWLAAASVTIWVCHTYGWAFLGLLCGSSLLAQAIAVGSSRMAVLKRAVIACWPLLLPLVPMVAWRSGTGGLDLMGWYIGYKVQWLISAFRTRWAIFDIPSLVFVIMLIYWAIRTKYVEIDRRMAIAAIVCLASFMLVPMKVFGSLFADMRLVPYVLITALLAISGKGLDSKTLRLLSMLAVAFFAARTLVTGASYIAGEKSVAQVLPTIESIPKGSRVAFFLVTPCKGTWELPMLAHMGGVALARRSVFVNSMWKVPGANPLDVNYPEAFPFEHDPSQFVHPGYCKKPQYPRLSRALARLPQQTFTHVWIVGQVPDRLVLPPGLEPIPHAGEGVLLEVRKPD